MYPDLKGPAIAAGHSRRGHDRERALVRLLRQDPDGPWVALRAPASLGVADVVAVRAGEIRLVEVKSTRAGPFAGFGPADRRALLDAAEVAGGQAYLVWWPPRHPPRWMPPEEWPPTP